MHRGRPRKGTPILTLQYTNIDGTLSFFERTLKGFVLISNNSNSIIPKSKPENQIVDLRVIEEENQIGQITNENVNNQGQNSNNLDNQNATDQFNDQSDISDRCISEIDSLEHNFCINKNNDNLSFMQFCKQFDNLFSNIQEDEDNTFFNFDDLDFS
ncbi:hypothetical protein M9Y10_004322 [Tritrichomonas musculus]|uniref:Uncharacterized protein n=1 Tax=Tritrichomonas musculus TaxID=1915356 RepID=A0ABR2JSI0_9EUKA